MAFSQFEFDWSLLPLFRIGDLMNSPRETTPQSFVFAQQYSTIFASVLQAREITATASGAAKPNHPENWILLSRATIFVPKRHHNRLFLYESLVKKHLTLPQHARQTSELWSFAWRLIKFIDVGTISLIIDPKKNVFSLNRQRCSRFVGESRQLQTGESASDALNDIFRVRCS